MIQHQLPVFRRVDEEDNDSPDNNDAVSNLEELIKAIEEKTGQLPHFPIINRDPYVLHPTVEPLWTTPLQGTPLPRHERALLSKGFKPPPIKKEPLDAGIPRTTIRNHKWQRVYFDTLPALERLSIESLWHTIYLLDTVTRDQLTLEDIKEGLTRMAKLQRDNIAAAIKVRQLGIATTINYPELGENKDATQPVLFPTTKIEAAQASRKLFQSLTFQKRFTNNNNSNNNSSNNYNRNNSLKRGRFDGKGSDKSKKYSNNNNSKKYKSDKRSSDDEHDSNGYKSKEYQSGNGKRPQEKSWGHRS